MNRHINIIARAGFAISFLLFFTSQGTSCLSQGLTSATVIPSLKWQASDKPYKDVEDRIKQEYAEGKGLSLQEIASEYHAKAKDNSKDPVAQFAWVYAERGAVWVSNSGGPIPRNLLDTLTKADPGNVREYTRYRFCLTDEANLVLPLKNAELIGGRLLASNPKDNWVRSSLINMLCGSTGGTKKALPHALNWVQQDPNNAKAHSSLAQVYFDQWEESGRKSKTLGDQATAQYKAYLKLAPANDGFRHHAESFIQHIQQANHTKK